MSREWPKFPFNVTDFTLPVCPFLPSPTCHHTCSKYSSSANAPVSTVSQPIRSPPRATSPELLLPFPPTCTPVPHQDGLYSSPCRVPRCLIAHIHSTLERFQESLRAALALGQLLALKASRLFCRLHPESSRHICSHHLVRPRRLVGQSQLCFRSDLDRQSGFVLGVFFPPICINITVGGWFVPQ